LTENRHREFRFIIPQKHMKVISRIQGGLGNQLFCYAAARRLALTNGAELVLDTESGFRRDYTYKRTFSLAPFNIPARHATQAERLEPLRPLRKRMILWRERNLPLQERSYIIEHGLEFDPRLLSVSAKDTVWLDGFWQSEGYFKDVQNTIRNDLTMVPPKDEANLRMAERIRQSTSVCLHVRFFDQPGSSGNLNLKQEYYEQAVAWMDAALPGCHYFIFSDRPEATGFLRIKPSRYTVVTHNRTAGTHYADLWLMTQCSGYIIANSTFSWWAAWLRNNQSAPVVCSGAKITGATAWGFAGLIPETWIQLETK
jgi:hypothetical protein